MREKVRDFFTRLTYRKEEVKRRCRTVLQAWAEELHRGAQADSQIPTNGDPTLALI